MQERRVEIASSIDALSEETRVVSLEEAKEILASSERFRIAVLLKNPENEPNFRELIEQAIEQKFFVKENVCDEAGIENIPFTPSKRSPLPSVENIKFDPSNRTLLNKEDKEDGVYWLAVLDLDNTLYQAESKHSIMLHHFAKFLRKKHATDFVEEAYGDFSKLKELITYCDQWEGQRKKTAKEEEEGDDPRVDKVIQYEHGIIKSGALSAESFKNIPIKKLEDYGREFVEEGMGGEFFEYTEEILQLFKDYGVLPVITTGLPDFLLPAILEKLNLSHGRGMTYKTDNEGRLTGEIDTNTGLAKNKARYCKALTRKHYGIAFAMGDSTGDLGLFRASTGRSRSKNDVTGAAVVVNASEKTLEEIRRNYVTDIDKHRMQIVDSTSAPDMVTTAVKVGLRIVFEPMHPKTKELEEIQERHHIGKKHPNLGNLKRIRNALKTEGLDDEQICDIFHRFEYPKEIIEEVIKYHIIDTRNSKDFERHLEAIGLTRKMIEEILRKNSEHYRKNGEEISPKSDKRPISTPPPVNTDED